MKKLKLLHVANWYPNEDNPFEALWIKDQIDSLNPHADNTILHLNISKGKWSEKTSFAKENNVHFLLKKVPFIFWRFYEYWYAFQLKKIWKKHYEKEGFDAVVFHIAYPVLTYTKAVLKTIKKPCVINEHWSAYHFQFGLNHKIKRIQNIFKHNIPLITVSENLHQSIVHYSEKRIEKQVLPNVVKNEILTSVIQENRTQQCFMLSNWKWPKNPLLAIEAFTKSEAFTTMKLVIGGYGHQWDEITQYVNEKGLKNRVVLLGKMNSIEIAEQMQKSMFFAHPTEHETFSVVVAEALASGTPVLASNKGAIPELVNQGNGVLVENEIDAWVAGFNEMAKATFDHQKIAQPLRKKLSIKNIGTQYYKYVKKAIDEFEG